MQFSFCLYEMQNTILRPYQAFYPILACLFTLLKSVAPFGRNVKYNPKIPVISQEYIKMYDLPGYILRFINIARLISIFLNRIYIIHN